ncbi:protein of unknown function [Oenococcus oeni]|nr:hypothetical protein OENI_230015 [Oenococcus oeni]SYW01902.1 hypothetical protein OENI_40100 [Oenococcus oeni]SYW18286.1 hypothetical protein OENI_30100 [Oenococcus oeni]VDC14222.1 protein of unknown function [Oenococcus oeni]
MLQATFNNYFGYSRCRRGCQNGQIVVLKHGRKADEISAPEDKTNTEEINLIAAQIKTLILSD